MSAHCPDEKKGQPAEDGVGPDAFFLAVIDGTKVKHVLEIPPAPLHLRELLIAEGDVLGREGGVRGAKEILVVQLLCSAATAVVPEPRKGSNTISLGRLEFRSIRAKSSTGFVVGCASERAGRGDSP